jgi:D-arabinose 5-phosphate isomerase GutQ
MKAESANAVKAAFEIEIEALKATADRMDYEAFGKAVNVLSKAQRIAAAGCGHSGICCQHFAHLMCCMEKPARFISPAEAVHGAMGFIRKDEVLILASRGGKTQELIPILNIARQKSAVIIVITESKDSPLARGADIVLPMKVPLETDKYNSQGTASFVALSAVFDALQAALIEETGYQNEQFALIHPAGAVGDRLNKSSDRPCKGR